MSSAQDQPEELIQEEAQSAGGQAQATSVHQQTDSGNSDYELEDVFALPEVASASKKYFPYVKTNERTTLALTVTIGAALIPLAWSQAHVILGGLLSILGQILALAGAQFTHVLGWSVLLYPISLCIVFSILYDWINRFSQANKIELSQNGLLIGWPSRKKKMVPWTEISSVFLFRPANTMLPQKWLVGFGTAMGRPLNIRLPVASVVGEELVELLQAHCHWASIDPALIEAFEPSNADVHTELWLKSLSTAPHESALMPLFPGALLREERYLILSRIGVGGQGTAYLAMDKSADKEVVIKETLFPVFVDAEIREQAEKRFRQEVDLLGRLKHDHVVYMHDSFVEEHRGYLVLDFIDGLSLRQRVIKEGKLSDEQVRNLAVSMCEVLRYLHGLTPPVVHRDFTPDNLILDSNQKLVLIDFNVARQTEATKTSTVVGKHAYIPPEQFRGEADTRSDIYAFGATLFYLLTGADPEAISQSFPQEFNPSVSDLLNDLVSKATAQQAVDRFENVEQILSLLNGAKH